MIFLQLFYEFFKAGLFAIGDVVSSATGARISSVFATLMLFLILFVAGVLPGDIIEKAGIRGSRRMI